jgi:hypothetical protein
MLALLSDLQKMICLGWFAAHELKLKRKGSSASILAASGYVTTLWIGSERSKFSVIKVALLVCSQVSNIASPSIMKEQSECVF